MTEVREASAFVKFRLLMWKNFLQQWRSPMNTFTDVLLPSLLIVMLVAVRTFLEPVSHDVTNYPSLDPYSIDYIETRAISWSMNMNNLSIAYSPRSPKLEEVLKNAIVNIFGEDARVTIQGFERSSLLYDLYGPEDAIRNVLAAVQFDDSLLGANDLPENVSFSLRYPQRPRQYAFSLLGSNSWHTNEVFPSEPPIGPRERVSVHGGIQPGYVIETFIALQHAISMELTKQLTNQDLDSFSIAIQRYPHPSFIEDNGTALLGIMLPLILMISLSIPANNTTRMITLEKELQLKETMKIMGLSTWLHWTTWFCKTYLLFLILALVTMIVLKVPMFTSEDGLTSFAMLNSSHWSVILIMLLVYFAAAVFFCFIISTFFHKAETASMFMGTIWFIFYIPSFLLIFGVNIAPVVQGILSLSLNVAVTIALQEVLAAESTGGLQWGNLMTNSRPDRLSFGVVMIILVFDCILYMLLALYMEKINPGPYGVPLKWYFPVQRSYWRPNPKVLPHDDEDTARDYEIIQEDEPTDLSIGIKTHQITKVFKRNVAVDKLSMNIYNDQITVLLGHNGAGKSTVISMLTGNLEPTSGSATLAGYDIAQQLPLARANLGFCPQHNILFRDLTVQEHLEFFATFKGFTGQTMKNNVNSLINKLELTEKRNTRANQISGGQKRRLSVGIALSGSSRVVLLDEPTSGMDPSSRRALWELLQREKKGRTFILTTHFMDEADFLGDRVAIMASGRLKCIGSPYFLKHHYGVGYTLVMVKEDNFNEPLCTKTIEKHVPGTTVKEDRGTEVTYSLSNNYSSVFENLLIDLENNNTTIGFKDYGLVATTMEDVFMKVGSDVLPLNEEIGDHESNGLLHEEHPVIVEKYFAAENRITGPKLWIQHVVTTWMKLILVWSVAIGNVITLLLFPIVIMTLTIFIVNSTSGEIQGGLHKRALTLFQDFPPTETWLQYNGSDSGSLGALVTKAYSTMFDSDHAILKTLQQPLDEVYLQEGSDPAELAEMRQRVLIGATIDESSATAWFSNFGFHDVAISLATVHSALLKALRPTATINVANHPLMDNFNNPISLLGDSMSMTSPIATSGANSIAIISAVFITFYIKERKTRAKLLQKAAGIEPALMWFASAVFDWILFMIISFTFIIIFAAFQVYGLSTGPEIGFLLTLFAVYGAAMLPLNYVLSPLFDKHSTGFSIKFFLDMLIGVIGVTVVQVLSLGTNSATADTIDSVLMFVPIYGFVSGLRQLNFIGWQRRFCLRLCLSLFDEEHCTPDNMCNITEMCCIPDNMLRWERPGVGRHLVAMTISCLVLWTVHLLLEYQILHRVFARRRTPPPVVESSVDGDVLDEMRHVEHISGSAFAQNNLISKRLTKYFGKKLAVNQISFTVGSSECFGLLGVNGAGKTTTFKMLMGDQSVSHGDAFVRGHSIRNNIRAVHKNIGYCPQFDSMFTEMTGRQNLRLFALLLGVKRENIAPLTAQLADNLGFSKHLDKRVKQFSGGNKRKLSAAVAMMGHSALMFLDEPTTGVDPAAKRQVWNAIRRATKSGRGVVLTSHSMEECEALCSRLTIMVNGQFQCLGTPQHLKNKFSQGFILTIKISVDGNAEQNQLRTEALKTYVALKFNEAELKEEYKGLLSYYLHDRDMAWSKMFGVLELAKRELHVEDYTISQTTLEQIFLMFTKHQQQEDQTS